MEILQARGPNLSEDKRQDMLRIVAERAVLPFVIMSQTVPIVAFAPLVSAWGGKLKVGSGEWQPWMSVALISAFLAFAPIAVGFGLGVGPLAGFLAGAIGAGTLMAVFLANSGGAWDNSK